MRVIGTSFISSQKRYRLPFTVYGHKSSRRPSKGRTLTLRWNAELRFGKVRRESPVHADSEIGAPLSVMPHSCSVKVRPDIGTPGFCLRTDRHVTEPRLFANHPRLIRFGHHPGRKVQWNRPLCSLKQESFARIS